MADVFDDYAEAAAAARRRANSGLGLDAAIRKVKEYGKTRYAVSYAAVMDSDYALAEIVKPDPPRDPGITT